MQVVISGRHTHITDGEKAVIEEKIERYNKKVSGLTKIDVVINLENDRHLTELILHVAHSNPLVAHAEATSNLGALDLVIQKMDNLVSKLNGKRNDHHK
jgi:putative sigma-54 modulation protein